MQLQKTTWTALALLLALTAVAADQPRHWYTPWRKAPAAAPIPVQELDLSGSAAGAVRQYWNRNNLRLDLTAVSGAGDLVVRPGAVNGWPVRIEFAVRPGSIGALEVRGDKRVHFTVPAAAGADGEPQVLQLGTGVYTRATRAIELHWQ